MFEILSLKALLSVIFFFLLCVNLNLFVCPTDCDGVVVEVNFIKEGKSGGKEVRKEAKDSIFNVKQWKPSKAQQQRAETSVKGATAAAAAGAQQVVNKKQQQQQERLKELAKRKEREQLEIAVTKDQPSSSSSSGIRVVGNVVGAIPKASKKTAFAEKLSKLDSLRGTFQKHLSARGGKSDTRSSSLMNAYFQSLKAAAASNDILVTMDNDVFSCPMAHQEFRRITDVLRQNVVDYKGEFRSYREALAEERRARNVQISKELQQEKELSFYLYGSAKRLIREKEKADARSEELRSKLTEKQEQLRVSRSREREAQEMLKNMRGRIRELEANTTEGSIPNAHESLEPVLRELERSGGEDMTARLVSDVQLEDPAIASMGHPLGRGDRGEPHYPISPGDDELVVLAESGSDRGGFVSSQMEEDLEQQRQLLKELYPDASAKEIEEMLEEHEREDDEDNLDEAVTHDATGNAADSGDEALAPEVLEAMLKMRSEQRRELLIGGGVPGSAGEQLQKVQQEQLQYQRLIEQQQRNYQMMLHQQLQQQQQQQQAFAPRFHHVQQQMQRPLQQHPQTAPGGYVPPQLQQLQRQLGPLIDLSVPVPRAPPAAHLSPNRSTSLAECAICYDPLDKEDRFPLQPCGHDSFHRNCVRTWLKENSNCPFCRQHIKLEEDFPRLERAERR